MAAATLLLRPETLAGAVLFRPMVPLVPERLPDLARKPVLIVGGRMDPIVPQEQTESVTELLRRAGADVTLHWSSDGHQVSGEDIAAARAWLQQALPARRATPNN